MKNIRNIKLLWLSAKTKKKMNKSMEDLDE